MKYLLIFCLFLIGCKNHKEEAQTINKKAEAFCDCHNGILQLSITEYNSLDDHGNVICRDNSRWFGVEELVYACGKRIE